MSKIKPIFEQNNSDFYKIDNLRKKEKIKRENCAIYDYTDTTVKDHEKMIK